MQRIVISLILFSFVQCNAMNRLKACRKDRSVTKLFALDIIWFVLFEEAECLDNLLNQLKEKKLLNEERLHGKTALHLAAIPICTEKDRVLIRLRMVKALVNAGSDTNLKDDDAKTAAQCLQEVEDFEGKQELLEALAS